jgi:hypothetical protein
MTHEEIQKYQERQIAKAWKLLIKCIWIGNNPSRTFEEELKKQGKI